jgi:hypothetical protein
MPDPVECYKVLKNLKAEVGRQTGVSVRYVAGSGLQLGM